MKTTEATDDAIEHVINHLWANGRDELKLLESGHDEAANYVVNRREEGAPTFAMWHDGEPLFITGLVFSDTSTNACRGMMTWFLATDRFPLFYREITRRLKRGIEEQARKFDLDYVEIFSACIDYRAGRWFQLMGFEIDLDYHHVFKGHRFYRFVRRFRRGDHVL